MGFSIFTDLITPTKYKVPDAVTVDPGSEQLANTQANAAAFAGAKKLASDYNDYMQQEVSRRLKQTMPEFEGLQSQAAANLAAGLRGELSASDAAASQRSSAARALGLGIGGSGAGAALTARDLGLKQYQLQQQAQSQLPGYLSTIAGITKAPLFDFSNTFLTPAQRIEIAFKNKTNQWNVQNLRNQMAVQPEPWMKSLAGLGDSVVNAAAAYFTMGGSAMGGGGSSSGGGGSFKVGDYMQQSRMMQESSAPSWGGQDFMGDINPGSWGNLS